MVLWCRAPATALTSIRRNGPCGAAAEGQAAAQPGLLGHGPLQGMRCNKAAHRALTAWGCCLQAIAATVHKAPLLGQQLINAHLLDNEDARDLAGAKHSPYPPPAAAGLAVPGVACACKHTTHATGVHLQEVCMHTYSSSSKEYTSSITWRLTLCCGLALCRCSTPPAGAPAWLLLLAAGRPHTRCSSSGEPTPAVRQPGRGGRAGCVGRPAAHADSQAASCGGEHQHGQQQQQQSEAG